MALHAYSCVTYLCSIIQMILATDYKSSATRAGSSAPLLRSSAGSSKHKMQYVHKYSAFSRSAEVVFTTNFEADGNT